jgi:serine/threonine protein kinase
VVGTADHQCHPLVSFTGLCTPVCLSVQLFFKKIYLNLNLSDIKPQNFVLTPTAHILLIDFGSAAPLLPPRNDGSQQIPKRYCLVPCGTCDYISPEILQAHEEALVALELTQDDHETQISSGSGAGERGKDYDEDGSEIGGYGRETDWWSLGAMLYEMAYGIAPFFANDIRQTYLRIMDHDVRASTIREKFGLMSLIPDEFAVP